ncbi:unnamed protein product [Symbiodinium sp. CCMP2592]|nr:unnamed protein product [Symbiodinium sp. CCMP2592]
MTDMLSVFGFVVGLLAGLAGMIIMWVLQSQSKSAHTVHSEAMQPVSSTSAPTKQRTDAMEPTDRKSESRSAAPPGLPDPFEALLPDIMSDVAADATGGKPVPPTTTPTPLTPTAPTMADGAHGGVATATAVPAPPGDLASAMESMKSWMSGELQEQIQTLFEQNLRSLHATTTPTPPTTSTPDFDYLQAEVDSLKSSIQGMIKIQDKIVAKLDELGDLGGRRHAYMETSTDGTQDQLRGITRDVQALGASHKEHRQANKDAAAEAGRRFMEVLKELATLSSKVHNGFAGLSGIGRSAMAAAQEAKAAAEQGLEIGEKTLAAVRVAGPSPSERELLEGVAESQKALEAIKDQLGTLDGALEGIKQQLASPLPPPPHNPPAVVTQVVPPPPQHTPNLVHLTGGSAPSWNTPPTVMVGNPQHLLRMLAGHSDGSN